MAEVPAAADLEEAPDPADLEEAQDQECTWEEDGITDPVVMAAVDVWGLHWHRSLRSSF